LSEDKVIRTSDARRKARITLALLILAYFSYIILVIVTMLQLGGPSITREEKHWFFLLQRSAFYLGCSLAVVPQIWYLYCGVERKRGSEGPDVGVGVVVPIVIGYAALVLVPFIYPSIGSLVATTFRVSLPETYVFIYLYSGLVVSLLGPVYVILFYLFVVWSRKGGQKEDKKAQTSQGEGGPTTEEPLSDDNTAIAFELLVLGYGLLLAGPLIGYVFQKEDPRILPISHTFYLGASVMVLSQVWYLLVGRNRKLLEERELRNTLLKYVVAPTLVGYAVSFVVPVLGLMPFVEAYRYAFTVFRNLLVPVLFFLGPIYAALFYVYRIA